MYKGLKSLAAEDRKGVFRGKVYFHISVVALLLLQCRAQFWSLTEIVLSPQRCMFEGRGFVVDKTGLGKSVWFVEYLQRFRL